MQIHAMDTVNKRETLYRRASLLALITIFYNIVEGFVSVFFGFEDETIALFGFGLDSFVEVVSGIGIWHMVRRLKQHPASSPDPFEKRALTITGTAFYILVIGLVIGSAINIIQGHHPETTVWGIVVASISILTMGLLIHFKRKVGRQLQSQAIIADANCTKACLYLSIVLLMSSVSYELTGIGGLDAIGALFIAWFSFKEGREAFEKASGKVCCECHDEANCHISRDRRHQR